MTAPDEVDGWRRYWDRLFESGRRGELEDAAGGAPGGWLTADVPVLVEEMEFDPDAIVEGPDGLLSAARTGFERFVRTGPLDGPDDETSFGHLTIHLAGLERALGRTVDFADPVAVANTLRVVRTARVADGLVVETEPAALTYRCPAGHETTIEQPLHRRFTVDTCGRPRCTNAVVPVDRRTRPRRVARFTVDGPDGDPLPCLATGKYAADTTARRAVGDADRLHLTGVPRLVVTPDGAVDVRFEVTHAEPS